LRRLGDVRVSTAARVGNAAVTLGWAAHLAGLPTGMARPDTPPVALAAAGLFWVAAAGLRRLWRRLGASVVVGRL